VGYCAGREGEGSLINDLATDVRTTVGEPERSGGRARRRGRKTPSGRAAIAGVRGRSWSSPDRGVAVHGRIQAATERRTPVGAR
jgi:hypothetical protein